MCLDPHEIYYLLELEGAIIGMGALHQIREKVGEIKRMYIRPAYRGKGYGKALLQQLLQKAKEFGFHTVYLDSGRFMTTAHNLYRSFGFIECKEYPETEVPPKFRPQWLFMKKEPRRRHQITFKQYSGLCPLFWRKLSRLEKFI